MACQSYGHLGNLPFSAKRNIRKLRKLRKLLMNISRKVIGCAITVHRQLGCGFYESVYEKALAIELKVAGIHFVQQPEIKVRYRSEPVGSFFLDFIIEHQLVLELKALSKLENIHMAQVINYLAASRLPVGLLLNFGANSLQVKRLVYRLGEGRLI